MCLSNPLQHVRKIPYFIVLIQFVHVWEIVYGNLELGTDVSAGSQWWCLLPLQLSCQYSPVKHIDRFSSEFVWNSSRCECAFTNVIAYRCVACQNTPNIHERWFILQCSSTFICISGYNLTLNTFSHLLGRIINSCVRWIICQTLIGEQKVYFYFFQKTRTLQSRVAVTLFQLFTIAIYGRNCFDM